MRSLSHILQIAVIAVVVAAAAVRAACEDATELTLDGSGTITSSSWGGAIVGNLGALEVGDTIRACIEVPSGRRIDWYFAAEAPSRQWGLGGAAYDSSPASRGGAQGYYIAAPRSTPYPAPTSWIYAQRNTSNFTMEFVLTAEQVGNASGNFAVILHATSDCLGTGNACVVQYSMHKVVDIPPIVIIIVAVVVAVVIIIVVTVVVVCCCCRKKDPPTDADGAKPADEGGFWCCCRKTTTESEPAGGPVAVQSSQKQV